MGDVTAFPESTETILQELQDDVRNGVVSVVTIVITKDDRVKTHWHVKSYADLAAMALTFSYRAVRAADD